MEKTVLRPQKKVAMALAELPLNKDIQVIIIRIQTSNEMP
jgi:hypothetical protein